MRFSRLLDVVVSAVALACIPVIGHANEGLTPLQPGVTTGAPLGALPPPGVYVTLDSEYVGGSYHDTNGRTVPIKVSNAVLTPSVLWSTPFNILGAHYGAGAVLATSYRNTDTLGVGGRVTSNYAVFNPIFTPVILSWDLPHSLHLGLSTSFYAPLGRFDYRNKTRLQTSYANGYFTFEPGLALSYLNNGWNLTVSNFYDVNAQDQHTGYKSGDTYYADLTATKTIGKVTFGAIGNYTQQIANDYKAHQIVGDGNKVQHVMIGPYLSYQFDRFTLTGRILQDVRSRNDINLTFAHLSISTSF